MHHHDRQLSKIYNKHVLAPNKIISTIRQHLQQWYTSFQDKLHVDPHFGIVLKLFTICASKSPQWTVVPPPGTWGHLSSCILKTTWQGLLLTKQFIFHQSKSTRANISSYGSCLSSKQQDKKNLLWQGFSQCLVIGESRHLISITDIRKLRRTNNE